MTFNFNKECVQCGKMTIKRCVKCFEPLCEKCAKPKKPIWIPIYNITIPARLCERCINTLPSEILNETENITNSFIDSLRRFFE